MGHSKAKARDDEADSEDHVHDRRRRAKEDVVKKTRSSSKAKVDGDQSSAHSISEHSSINPEAAPPQSGPRTSELSGANQRHPYFFYQNNTDSQPTHYFSLHTDPNQQYNGTIYDNCGTTLTIIIVLHLIYFFQWNKRRSRQDVCTSYEQLVEKKQYYRAALAIASHPPVDGGERDTIGGSGSHHGAMNGGEGQYASGPIERAGLLGRCFSCRLFNIFSPILQRIRPIWQMIRQRIFHPLVYGSLSGLPLLAFASHILWQCRALEELYDEHDGRLILGVSGNANTTQFTGIGTAATKIQTAGDVHMSSVNEGYTYFRVLVALAFICTVLELSLSCSILRSLDRTVDFDGYRTTPRQLLGQRSMCSIASLSTAILGVYDAHFPYAPPPVLPFVRVSALSASGFSQLFSIAILCVLVHRIHPVTSIISGLLSGSLWSLGFTTFLGTRYWGNALLLSLAFGMLLSLKAQPASSKFLELIVPCIDYVSWDRNGELVGDNTSAPRSSADRDINNDGDLEMGSRFPLQNGGQHSEERFPLLSSQSSSMSRGSRSAIRGRVPLMNTMESDLSGAEDFVQTNEVAVPAASSPRSGARLSRRAGGGAGAQ